MPDEPPDPGVVSTATGKTYEDDASAHRQLHLSWCQRKAGGSRRRSVWLSRVSLHFWHFRCSAGSVALVQAKVLRDRKSWPVWTTEVAGVCVAPCARMSTPRPRWWGRVWLAFRQPTMIEIVAYLVSFLPLAPVQLTTKAHLSPFHCPIKRAQYDSRYRDSAIDCSACLL